MMQLSPASAAGMVKIEKYTGTTCADPIKEKSFLGLNLCMSFGDGNGWFKATCSGGNEASVTYTAYTDNTCNTVNDTTIPGFLTNGVYNAGVAGANCLNTGSESEKWNCRIQPAQATFNLFSDNACTQSTTWSSVGSVSTMRIALNECTIE